MKFSLFIPCLPGYLYPDSGNSMVKILHHPGHETEYVKNQTCCGQPAFNFGNLKAAITATERFIEHLKENEYVVATSGSFLKMVRIFYKDMKINDKLRPALNDVPLHTSINIANTIPAQTPQAVADRIPYRQELCHIAHSVIKAVIKKLAESPKTFEANCIWNGTHCIYDR